MECECWSDYKCSLCKAAPALLTACEGVARLKGLILPENLISTEYREEIAALQIMYDKLESAITAANL
jgi:hypothetical protein